MGHVGTVLRPNKNHNTRSFKAISVSYPDRKTNKEWTPERKKNTLDILKVSASNNLLGVYQRR